MKYMVMILGFWFTYIGTSLVAGKDIPRRFRGTYIDFGKDNFIFGLVFLVFGGFVIIKCFLQNQKNLRVDT